MELGKITPVNNTNHKFGETDHYLHINLSDGESEFPVLFTEHEMREAIIRAKKNPEDLVRDEGCNHFFELIKKGIAKLLNH